MSELARILPSEVPEARGGGAGERAGDGGGHDRFPVPHGDHGTVGERAATLAGLAAAARGHAGRARAASTERGYAGGWTRFRLWCGDLVLDPLPADPLTVALYVTALAPAWRPAGHDDPPETVVAGAVCERDGLAPGSIARALAAIAVHHRAAGHPSPTRDPRVADVLSGIRRHPGVAAPRRVARR